MSEYHQVPVAVAEEIAFRFEKDIVVILCWSEQFEKLHTTTFGQSAQDKLLAAEIGESLARHCNCDLSQTRTYEDFRLDAGRLKEENDRLKARLAELEQWQ